AKFTPQKVLLKRLHNLAWDEFKQANKHLHISSGDIILVEDPNTHSKKTIEFLRGRVGVIVFKQKPRVCHEGFVYISSSELGRQMLSVGDFALINKKAFDEVLARHSILNKIVEDYQKLRKAGLKQ
ncbi:hypothetical protein DRJ48_03425, partial [Candidatus Woesearchaeota archaeon]